MSKGLNFNTREEFYNFIGKNGKLQVWHARSSRWAAVKDPKASYHPYNTYRIAPAGDDQSVRFKCHITHPIGNDSILNTSYHVDTPLSNIKKSAKSFAGLKSIPGKWVSIDNIHEFTPRDKSIGKVLSIEFVR